MARNFKLITMWTDLYVGVACPLTIPSKREIICDGNMLIRLNGDVTKAQITFRHYRLDQTIIVALYCTPAQLDPFQMSGDITVTQNKNVADREIK